MAERTVVISRQDLVLVALSAGGAQSYEFDHVPGDFSYTTPGYSRSQWYDNGVPRGARRNQAEPASLAFTGHLRDVGGDTAAITMLDLLHWNEGRTSYWNTNAVSTSDGETDIKTVDLEGTVEGSSYGSTDKTMLFPDVELKTGGAITFGELGSVPVAGQCLTALAPQIS